jgi:hypothetical protein
MRLSDEQHGLQSSFMPTMLHADLLATQHTTPVQNPQDFTAVT